MTTTKKKSGVTAKTLGAIKEQIERIEEAKLLNAEEMKQLKELMQKVKNNWITKNL